MMVQASSLLLDPVARAAVPVKLQGWVADPPAARIKAAAL